jgi:hypothetical protein
MQRWKKILLLVLPAVVGINMVLYYIWLLTGIDKTPVNVRYVTFWMPIAALAMLIDLLVSFVMVEKSRTQWGALKNMTTIQPPTRYLIYILALLLLIVVNLAVLILQPKAFSPLMLNTLILLVYIYGFGSGQISGLYDKGVLRWGAFYAWDTVIAYRVKDRKQDSLLILEIPVKNGKRVFDYEIKILLRPEEKAETLDFVKSKLDPSKLISPGGPPGRA